MKNRRSALSKLFYLLLSALTAVLLFSCEDLFQTKIPMTVENDTLGSLFRGEETGSKLDTPSQFFIAQNYSSSEIRLTWSEVYGAAFYMVERAIVEPQVISGGELFWADPDDGDFQVLDSFVYGTFFVDEIMRNPGLDSPEYNYKYFYRVSAFNTARKVEESNPTIPHSAMLFRPPVNAKASGGVSIEWVEVRWDASPGATSYEIWRSELPNGASASLLGSVTGNQTWFRNNVSSAEQGKDFYYMVRASNSFGNQTLLTRPAYGYARMFGAPDDPKNVKLVDGSGRGDSTSDIKIKWDAVDEVDAYYAVYRYSEIDSSLIRLIDKTESTTWTDSQGLRPGIYYYYKVQAIVDDISSGRALRSQFSSNDPQGFILSPPPEVIAEKTSGGSVTVKWRPAIGSEYDRSQYTYHVYAGSSQTADFTIRVRTGVSPSIGADGYISVEGLSIASGNFFRVSTVKGAAESNQSVVVSPSPAAATLVSVSKYAFVSLNERANSNGIYPVMITWKKPADENPAYYNIQRSTKLDSGYSKINEVALPSNGPWSDVFTYNSATGEYTYIDRNEMARVGRKYYYRVLSLNELEQGSFPSGGGEGWGALTHEQYLIEFNKTMSSGLKKLTYMHKPGSTDKLGTETKNGTISGTIYYNAAISGLGARIIIQLTNYADFYIENEPNNGVYFTLNGNSNTSANMSSNGTMDGTMNCTGMYPGKVYYDNIEIKGGAAGGGTYGVHPDGGFSRREIVYTVIN
jgi:hypothetical protein